MNPEFPAAYYETRFQLESAPEPLPSSFAVITAWNPMDRRWSQNMNVAADHRLHRLLQRKLMKPFRATGQSPDGAHSEPGWAMECQLSQALAIGRRYRQRGIWWIEEDDLHLHSCFTPHSEIIAKFSQRCS